MQRKITSFDLDEDGHWRVLLECGHRRHVRHDPPMTSREWVLSQKGRKKKIGLEIECRTCDQIRNDRR